MCSDPLIRSMDFTETFHQEDTIALTEEEKKEAEQLQKDEQLRRSDPAAYNEMMSKRSRWTNPVTPTAHPFPTFNPAFDSPGQGFPHFNPAIHSTGLESSFFGLTGLRTGQPFPFLDRDAIPPLPEASFDAVSAASSPGWPPAALPGSQSMPVDLTTRCNSAPPSSANDPVPKVDQQNASSKTDENELAVPTESHPNRIYISPILSASTSMMPRDAALPEKQDDPATWNLKRQRDETNVPDSVAASAVDQAGLSPILGSNTSIRPRETSDDWGAYSPRRKRARVTLPSPVSEPVLNFSPFKPLKDLLSREAARMSKERPSSKT